MTDSDLNDMRRRAAEVLSKGNWKLIDGASEPQNTPYIFPRDVLARTFIYFIYFKAFCSTLGDLGIFAAALMAISIGGLDYWVVATAKNRWAWLRAVAGYAATVVAAPIVLTGFDAEYARLYEYRSGEFLATWAVAAVPIWLGIAWVIWRRRRTQ